MRAEYQKWDYITLPDFRAHSVGPFLSYGWLWFLAIVSVAVYGSDTFTAVSLLAYNRWSSQFVPVIPLDIAKWIFAGCILFSWTLCGYEWICAIRVIRRGNVAESYLNPLAVVVQSMRVFGGGMGWRRFLVFAELTKSKKGADYVALFCCFQFKGAIRVLLAEGPRQVINALTLYSVMKAKLLTDEGNAPADGKNSFVRFWVNVKVLYEAAPEQAVVLFTMLFTLIIWVFSILSLIIAFLFWVGFLLHYIPRDELPLNAYCRRKVDKRLGRVVNAKTKQAIEKEESKRRRDEEKGKDSIARPAGPTRKPTLPLLPEKTPTISSLRHANSVSSTATGLSVNSSFGPPPDISRQATLPQLDEDEPTLPQVGRESCSASDLHRSGTALSKNSNTSFGASGMNSGSPGSQHSYHGRPDAPLRSATESSDVSISSYGSNRPLLQNSAEPGYSVTPYDIHVPETQPTYQRTYGANNQYTTLTPRSNTGMSNVTTARLTPLPPRSITGMERKPLPIRSMTSSSQRSLGGPPNFNASYRGVPSSHLAETNRNNGYQAPFTPPEQQSFEMQPTRRPNLGAPATSVYMPYRAGAGLDATTSQQYTQGPWSYDPHPQPQSQAQQLQASAFMPTPIQQQYTGAALPLTHPQMPIRAMTVSNNDLASGMQHFDRVMPPARAVTAPNPSRGREEDHHHVGGGGGQGWMQARPPDGSHASGFRGGWV